MDVARITLIGRLTSDPEPQKGEVKLSLAVRYQWKTSQAKQRAGSELVIVYATGKLAAICKVHLHTRSRIYCEAHLDHGRFMADELIMLGSPKRAD